MPRYQKFKIAGKTVQAHRVIYESTQGPIPGGWHVHHIDGDSLNNSPSNLQALPPGEHSRIHNDRHPRTKECEVCGGSYEPAPTKRKRAKTCSYDCARVLMSRAAIRREAEKREVAL
jgi:hypothetical protein